MKKYRAAIRLSIGHFAKGVLFTALLIHFQCTENDPVHPTHISSEQRPGTVSWISVKTGLVDTSRQPPKEMSDLEYAKVLNRAGFRVSWSASRGAAYYEVRASRSVITAQNWNHAYFAARAAGAGDTLAVVIDKIHPSISGRNCTGCRACVGACPKHAITIYKGKAVIDPDSCIGCSRCYDKCTYSAVSDENMTKFYYFAVRGFSHDSVPAEEVTCTGKAYKSRYTNIAYKKPSIGLKWCGFCGASCFIINPAAGKGYDNGACPVNAIYYDSLPDIKGNPGLVFIDQSKCIACGLCVEDCGLNHGNWSVRREIISR